MLERTLVVCAGTISGCWRLPWGPSGGFTSDIQPDPMHIKLFTSTINYWSYDFLSDLHAITVPCFENLFCISCSSVVLKHWWDITVSDSKPIKLPQPVSSPSGHDCWCKAWRSVFAMLQWRQALLKESRNLKKMKGKKALGLFFREKRRDTTFLSLERNALSFLFFFCKL